MPVRSYGQKRRLPSDREQSQQSLYFPRLQGSADEAGIHRGEYIQGLPDTRGQLEKETRKFFSEMSIRDPKGQEVAYRNKIPEYEKEKKTDD